MKEQSKMLLSLCFTLCIALVHAQTDINEREESRTFSKVMVVLKANDKTVEIDNRMEHKFFLDDIEVNSIASIDVLKDQAAIDKYGVKAKEGAVIINFKDYKSLPDGTKRLFEQKKEER